jgi:glyoxylase-like metal-dependent hydrolase (beta-lactamase superfamily II)
VEVEPGIVGVEAGGAYAWIVRTTHGAVLVDAGLDAKGTAILRELKNEGFGPDDVEAVLLTHGHPDHFAAAPLFRKARILLGAADEPLLRGDTTHYGTFGRIMAAVMPMPVPPSITTALRGGERLDFDGALFTVIATPGHSPGSVVYLHDDVLFTGDSLMRKKDGLAIAPSLFSDDAAQNHASLRELGSVTFEKVADGHAGLTTDAKVKLNRLLAGTRGGRETTATR